jgi:hypothetical protein
MGAFPFTQNVKKVDLRPSERSGQLYADLANMENVTPHMIETKGDYLANDESKQKLLLGRTWADKAGDRFKYFMVFKDKDLKLDGAYTLDEFAEIARKL